MKNDTKELLEAARIFYLQRALERQAERNRKAAELPPPPNNDDEL